MGRAFHAGDRSSPANIRLRSASSHWHKNRQLALSKAFSKTVPRIQLLRPAQSLHGAERPARIGLASHWRSKAISLGTIPYVLILCYFSLDDSGGIF
jgi:hypothetical protein